MMQIFKEISENNERHPFVQGDKFDKYYVITGKWCEIG